MKITSKIHLLKLDFSVLVTSEKSLPRFVNVLIILGDEITIIDSGVKSSYKEIYDYIKANNRKVEDIKTLILSHSHPDHVGSASKIKNDTGCKVIGHILEKDLIENIDLQYAQRPVPGFYTLVDQSVRSDQTLTGDEEIVIDKNITAKIINTPGHSKGSFCILFKEDHILFTADSIPVENDIPTYDSYHDLNTSIQKIKSVEGYKTLLSSWSQPLYERNEILCLLEKGQKYMEKLNNTIKVYYLEKEIYALENCSKVIHSLKLPDVFINPLVDKAFRSHF
jgi:hydroxyacylglutathione hydrolase